MTVDAFRHLRQRLSVSDRDRVRQARQGANRLAAELSQAEEAFYPAEIAEAIRQINALADSLEKGDPQDQREAAALRSLAFGMHRDHATPLARRRARESSY